MIEPVEVRMVVCTSPTRGLVLGQRYFIERDVADPQGPMLMVRPAGNPKRLLDPYWAWRFTPGPPMPIDRTLTHWARL